MSNCVVQVRIDENIKQKADALFDDLGFDTPTAIRMFLAQALKSHGLPFDVKQSDRTIENVQAINEIENHIKTGQGKTFKSIDDLFDDLES